MRTGIDAKVFEISKETLELGLQINYIKWNPDLTDKERRAQLVPLMRQIEENDEKVIELIEEKHQRCYSTGCCGPGTPARALADLLP